MGDVIKGKFGTETPDGVSILLCECGCPLWHCEDEEGRVFGMCPICAEDEDEG